jgi:hypothetical protein
MQGSDAVVSVHKSTKNAEIQAVGSKMSLMQSVAVCWQPAQGQWKEILFHRYRRVT